MFLSREGDRKYHRIQSVMQMYYPSANIDWFQLGYISMRPAKGELEWQSPHMNIASYVSDYNPLSSSGSLEGMCGVTCIWDGSESAGCISGVSAKECAAFVSKRRTESRVDLLSPKNFTLISSSVSTSKIEGSEYHSPVSPGSSYDWDDAIGRKAAKLPTKDSDPQSKGLYLDVNKPWIGGFIPEISFFTAVTTIQYDVEMLVACFNCVPVRAGNRLYNDANKNTGRSEWDILYKNQTAGDLFEAGDIDSFQTDPPDTQVMKVCDYVFPGIGQFEIYSVCSVPLKATYSTLARMYPRLANQIAGFVSNAMVEFSPSIQGSVAAFILYERDNLATSNFTGW